MEENKFTPPSDAVLAGPKKKGFTPPSDAILKKKESSQPTSQESLWGSNSQPKDLYTSLVTDQQVPQQVLGTSGGEQPKPILKGKPSIESLKKKPIQPKKEVAEIIKDTIPQVSKATSIEKGKEDFSEATQRARKESKSLVDKKQIDQKISEVNNIQNEYAKSLKEIDLAKKILSDEKSEIDYQMSIGNNTPELQEKIALHNKKVQENLDKFNLLKNKSEVINYNKKIIESASGNLLREKAEQGNWFGAIYNKMLEGASSISAGAVSRLTDLVAEVIPSQYLISPKELKGLKDKGLNQDQIDDYIKKSAKKEVIPTIRKANVELIGDKGTTEEYIRKKEGSGLVEGGILGLAGSVPAMMGGVYGRAANFFLSGSDAVEQEMESNPDFQNISENEKLAVIVPIGIANAVLEEFGLQGVLKNNSIVNKLVHKTLLKVGADASASTFKRAMNNEVKSGIASGFFKIASGSASEAVTGGSQQAAEITIKDIYNTVKDKKMFQTPETLSDAITQISDAAIMEGIGGTVMSTLPAINTAIKNNELGKKSTDFEFEILDNINENSEEFKKLFTTDLKNKIIEGKITKDEAESQLKSFDKMTSTFNRMPKDMSIEDKKKSFDLLVEKDKLTDEINGKDESLSTKQKERIAEINTELSNISLGVPTEVQEKKTEEITPVQTTEETNAQPQETISVDTTTTQPTENQAQTYSEELAKTKESDPEAYWSVSDVSPEDAAKGTIIDTPDGSALVKPDGDIAGLFKKLTSKAKGVAQDLLNKAVAAGGIKLDNFDGYLTKQYEKAGFRIVSRVPFSLEYGVPDGYNKEKHGTPDVVAMVYDPNNELDIEEKTFEDYDEAMAYRDSFVDQAKTNVEANDLGKLFDESESVTLSKDLPTLVTKAKTALSKILPKVDVILYDNEDAYAEAVGEVGDEVKSNGAFINNTVHINKNKANGRTVAHEVFHAILLNAVKTDANAAKVTLSMINAVMKSVSPDMKAKLQDFVESGYDSQKELWNEEKLAELVGYLADNYESLSRPNKTLVKQWLDQIAKLFGLKQFTDNEVVDLLNTIAGKVASGEVLTEEDVKLFNEEGSGGFVGTFRIPRQQAAIKAPKAKEDPRNFINKFVEDVNIEEFNGSKFITNMYDYTNAGNTDLGNGYSIDLFGGKGYVPYMMELNGKKIGDVSNLAAFNTKAQAETFIRNSEKSGAKLFAPHSGTKSQSWQFQQHTFAELVDLVLDKNILTNKELIDTFNNSIKGNEAFKNKFSKFSDKYGQKIKDFSSFINDPKTIVELLDINNNLSPDLRKALNNSIASNKKFQKAIGVKNKEEFYNKIMDPLNEGVTGGEIIGIVDFDPNTFKIIKTDPNDVDHHPSFGYALLAKINGIYQPTEFYKSYDITDSYTKYNINGENISIKSEDLDFDKKNVTSSAGAIPKVAEFNIPKRKQIIGEKAVKDKLVQDNLDVAKKMEAENKSAKDIFIATGWEKGVDNKWKYDMQEGVVEFKNKKSGKASDVINYPELFKAYPKAKDIDIVFMNSDKFDGMYLRSKNRIMLSNSLSDSELKSTLLHEVQHFIQNEEGFAVGGTAQTIKDLYNARIKYEKNFSVKKILNNIKNSLFKPNPESVKQDLNKLSKLVSKADEQLYKSIAGEVEAFNVEKRSKMTAEERKSTTLSESAKVPAEEQVVVSKSDTMLKDRKQTQSPLLNAIKKAKDAGKTDKAISTYLQSKGFTVKQITDALLKYNKDRATEGQKSEGVFTREGRNKVITFLDSIRRRATSARAFLPKSVFIAKEGIEAGIKSQSKQAAYLVKDFDNALSKYKGDKDKLISDFDRFIRGEEVELPDEFIFIGSDMRNHIDNLSDMLIKSGAVDEYQAENIKENIGSYLTRSYEVFDKKDWAKQVDKEVIQAAKNFLKRQLLSEATKEAKKNGLDVDSVLENKVDLAINDLIDREGAGSFISAGKTGSKDASILKQKTDIPLEIRALMGEYTDPAQNYSRTIFKIASLINNAKFLNTVKENGTGVFLFEKDDINRPKEFDTQIAAEGSETMNPLNGLYTTKEIAASLKEAAGLLNSIDVALPFEISKPVKNVYEYYMKALGSVKWLKTIASVGTHFKNLTGNITFMLANGYFKPDEYRKSAKVIYNDFLNKSDKELRDKMREYVEAGVVDQSAVLGELRDMFKNPDFDKTFERRMIDKNLNKGQKFINTVKTLGRKGMSLAENAYQAEDDYFKIVAYETEKNRYSKAIYGKEFSDLNTDQQKEVVAKVSEIVKNVLPNYGRVPGAVKLIKAFPVVGTFVSFQSEALRTAYNIVNLAKTEVMSDNPKIKAIGASRVAGIIASQAVKYGVMYLIGGSVAGDDEDKEKENAKRYVAPWSKNSNIIVKNQGDGKFSYIDISASDPFGGIVKPLNAMMSGDNLLDGFVDGLKELIAPFTNPDILKSMFDEIYNNKDAYGNELYNPNDSFEKKSRTILSRVYKTFEPGTITSARKIAESDGMLNEMAGQFTGYKAVDVDLKKQFQFKIYDMKENELSTRKIYTKAAREFEDKKITKEEMDKAYKQSNSETLKVYEELKKDYDAAIYFGAVPKELRSEMRRSKVSRNVVKNIATGNFKDLKKKKINEN